MSFTVSGEFFGSYEDELRGYEIYIEEGPDPYLGEISWFVSREIDLLDSGSCFAFDDALAEAESAVLRLSRKEN